MSQLDAEGNLEWAQLFLNGSFVAVNKEDDGIEDQTEFETVEVGKSSKIMVVGENGLPVGLYVDNAQPNELKLAEASVHTFSPPCKRGRSKPRPQELVADNAYHSANFRRQLLRPGLKPSIPPFRL